MAQRLEPGDPVWFLRQPIYEHSNLIVRPAVVVRVNEQSVTLDIYHGRDRVRRSRVKLTDVVRREVSIPGVIEDCGTVDTFRGISYNERKKALPDTLTDTDWQNALEYFGNRCAYCREEDYLIKEHYIPVSSPQCPGTVATNIVPACASCNNSKGKTMPHIWLSLWTDGLFVQKRIERYFDIVRRAQRKAKSHGDQMTLFG